MGIRIKLVSVNGQKRVPEDVMDLLLRFAGHRDFCDKCKIAQRKKTNHYCHIGFQILSELSQQPGVEAYED